MLIRIRLPAKITCHMYNQWLVSCLFLLNRKLLSTVSCLHGSITLGPVAFPKPRLRLCLWLRASFDVGDTARNVHCSKIDNRAQAGAQAEVWEKRLFYDHVDSPPFKRFEISFSYVVPKTPLIDIIMTVCYYYFWFISTSSLW